MQDGSWGLTLMIFAIMTFKLFIATTRLENHNFVVSLIWLFQYPKISDCFFQLVANPSRWEWICEFYYLVFITLIMKSIVCSNGEVDISIFIGYATSALDGSSSQDYSWIFLSIGSEVYSSISSSFIMTCIKQLWIHFLLDLYISSDARPALPMGVVPEAMVRYSEAIIGSEILWLLPNIYTPLIFPFLKLPVRRKTSEVVPWVVPA
jgi:hypothetical protein